MSEDLTTSAASMAVDLQDEHSPLESFIPPQTVEKVSLLLGKHLRRQGPGTHDDWSLGRLAMLSGLSVLGTMANIFAISAVMTEDQLKKKGNLLLVNLMLAGLLITAFVIPADIVGLLAGYATPTTPVCVGRWWLTCLAAHTALATLPCQAWENRLRIIGSPMQMTPLIVLFASTWIIAVSLTSAQWLSGLGPSHCGLPHTVDVNTHRLFTGSVALILVVLPVAGALTVHARTLLSAHNKVRPPRRSATSSPYSGDYKPQITSTKELALPAINLVVVGIAGSCWAVGIASDWWAANDRRPTLMWFPFTAAISTGFIYGGYKPFREAYIQLFHYCCCKTSVSISRRSRSEAAVAAAAAAAVSTRPASDVRVHIIPGYNMYSTAAARENRPTPHKQIRCKDIRRQKSPVKKDIYEL